ncbi:MAG: cell division protein FtsB [Neisseriaceae bacterium]|jgi:cell division protein FtsB|nr:cell division protein FtsB [Pseudomonadota bacterium]RTL03438.1 MAG: cell division protein FtsB [Neisseriaceae bacterium]TXH19873.1 MAG: cell division protein FtsB [Gammaproteobacteria bacterium]
MRILTLILVLLIAFIQYPLWVGKGSWLSVWKIDAELGKQQQANKQLETRNASLAAEVRDLKTGYDAIEERARNELGMIKQDEVFFQILDKPALPLVAPLPPADGKTTSDPKKLAPASSAAPQ